MTAGLLLWMPTEVFQLSQQAACGNWKHNQVQACCRITQESQIFPPMVFGASICSPTVITKP